VSAVTVQDFAALVETMRRLQRSPNRLTKKVQDKLTRCAVKCLATRDSMTCLLND
jgi:hypothetical protein